MASWTCNYTKTVRGVCEQQRAAGSDKCYYHTKVSKELIESDEDNALRDMPIIVL